MRKTGRVNAALSQQLQKLLGTAALQSFRCFRAQKKEKIPSSNHVSIRTKTGMLFDVSRLSMASNSLPKGEIVASPSLQLASTKQVTNQEQKKRMEVNISQPSGCHERHKPTYGVLKF